MTSDLENIKPGDLLQNLKNTFGVTYYLFLGGKRKQLYTMWRYPLGSNVAEPIEEWNGGFEYQVMNLETEKEEWISSYSLMLKQSSK